jgi:non-specific serine/threonine protein kinase
LLERCPNRDRNRVEAQIAAGQLAASIGDSATALAILAQAGELNAELGDPVLEAWIHFFQGLSETLARELERGSEHLEASRALHHKLGIRIGEARALAGLGGTLFWGGELDRAKELLDAALAIYIAEDDGWGQGQCHTFLGMISEAAAADRTRASSHYRNASEFLRPSRDATLLPVALLGQAGLIGRRDPAKALKVLAAASAMRARVGGEFQAVYRARVERIRADAEAALGRDAERVWTEGVRLGLDDAIGLAFGAPKHKPSSPAGLSARELEVARLVAEGMANKAIAARLHLSVRTVESHVRHLLSKLGLENRTQVAAWARQQNQ